ncbi:HlyD family secretion protein [Pseudomonas sp. GOM7]|uniref:HlyD family secretion protein n=1 Tax=Pseudomonas sp. GOM7 TaxID=2998079 RepID=UPI00227A56E7|nr:HlyD family secretion protein [Pseudomonas sp. GOM7]WAJ36962.1 HlyD family secretion protein [Pseudomonas sp. GOM7]
MTHAEPARPLAAKPVDLDSGYAMDAKTLRRLALFAAMLLCIALAFGAYWLLQGRFLETTDNAYVRADIVEVSSQLAGRITRVQAQDNQWVEAGDVLARLDDADYVYQEQRIQTQINDLQVQLHSLSNQQEQQQARIEAQAAEVQAGSAELGRQQDNLERLRALRRNGFVSEEQFSSLSANVAVARANVDKAKAGLKAYRLELEQLDNRRQQLQNQLDGAHNDLAQARLNLARTRIVAPIAGRVGNRSLREGQYVRPGEALLALVPRELWVQANFKETQVARMHPQQKVELRFDALPNLRLQGTLDSLYPATGAEFSLLPPDNATGNFTKVIQRVPVKIRLPENIPELERIRPGMSVIATVDSRD